MDILTQQHQHPHRPRHHRPYLGGGPHRGGHRNTPKGPSSSHTTDRGPQRETAMDTHTEAPIPTGAGNNNRPTSPPSPPILCCEELPRQTHGAPRYSQGGPYGGFWDAANDPPGIYGPPPSATAAPGAGAANAATARTTSCGCFHPVPSYQQI